MLLIGTGSLNLGQSLFSASRHAAGEAAGLGLGLARLVAGLVLAHTRLLRKVNPTATYLLGVAGKRSGRVSILLHLLLLIDLLLEFDDSGLDPGMLEGLLWRHSLFNLPFETLIDKVDKHLVVALHHLGEILRIRVANLAFAVGILQRAVVVVEENLSA